MVVSLSALRTGRLYTQEIFSVRTYIICSVVPTDIVRSEGCYVNQKSTDTSCDRTSDLPICCTAPYTFGAGIKFSILAHPVYKM